MYLKSNIQSSHVKSPLARLSWGLPGVTVDRLQEVQGWMSFPFIQYSPSKCVTSSIIVQQPANQIISSVHPSSDERFTSS